MKALDVNWHAGWMLIKSTWLTWLAMRSFFFLLAFGWMVPTLISLFVWSTAASGKTIGGLTQGEFIAYYLVFALVNQLTYSQTYWTVGDGIRSGGLNSALLRPISPIWGTLSAEVAGKVVMMLFVIPFTTVLALFLHPVFHTPLLNACVFVPILCLSWCLRFFWGYWIALLAFWITRADSFLAVQDSCIFLLAGQIAPVALLPGPLHLLATVLPFRYMVGFPVEVLTGHLAPVEIFTGLAFQLGWCTMALLLFFVIWRTGLKHYTAVGG